MSSIWILVVLAIIVGSISASSKGTKRKQRHESRNREPPFGRKDYSAPQGEHKLNDYLAKGNTDNRSNEARAQYRDKFELLNGVEQKLYWTLREAAPALVVFSQVSMSQVFHIDERTRDKRRKLNEVGKKSIDFLLCRADDMSIAVAIELNGRTHEKIERRLSDETKQRTLQEAGIPLIVLTPWEMPDVIGLRKLLAPHLVDRRKYEVERDKRMRR